MDAIEKILIQGELIRRQPKLAFTQAGYHYRRLYDKALHRTRLKPEAKNLRLHRHYLLYRLVKQSTGNHYAECGVFRGSTAYMMAHLIRANPEAKLHLFDSFEGLSPKTKGDEGTKSRGKFICSLDKVQNHLRRFKNINYYKGWFPDRFNDVKELRFTVVHIDVDLYEPTRQAIEFFYPRLCDRGALVFDDYGTQRFTGARRAINGFLKTLEKQSHLFIDMPAGSAFLMKFEGSNNV
jgi:hypothetical protein